MFKKFALMLAIVFVFASFSVAMAQTQENTTEIEVPEVSAEELGVASTSWFGNLWRDVKIFFTVDKIKKSDLELEKAGAQLLKLQEKMQNREKMNEEEIENKIEELGNKYNSVMNRVRERLQNLNPKEGKQENQRMEKFLQKYTEHNLKHEEILERLQEKLPEEVYGKIEANRQKHLSNFKETMESVAGKQAFAEKLKASLENLEDTSPGKVRKAIHFGVIEKIMQSDEELANQVEEKLQELESGQGELMQQVKKTYQEMVNKKNEIKNRIKNSGDEGQVQNQEQTQSQWQNNSSNEDPVGGQKKKRGTSNQ